ncbi:unnamed protein product [Meloidogyne enterolobii]|uniref:Uncharacterized protein n=1 Tax=Meloidogyne enterolobii TaxID=390850 RepID=A0ACB0XSU8_MELEN
MNRLLNFNPVRAIKLKKLIKFFQKRTFYVNLDELNQKGSNQVKTVLEYSMSEVYGLKTFDANEMNNLAERFAKNDTLFNLYTRYNRVMNGNEDNANIDRKIYICVIENLNLEELEACPFFCN